VSAPEHSSDWAQLLRIACALIHQVNSEQPIIDNWTLGGGTAMMLQINHRESHDVDIFLSDPQLLSFLDPQKRDFDLEVSPVSQDGDGARFLKLAFQGIGQIDFIVGQSMTPSPTTQWKVEQEFVQLETIPEIIVKKIYHRGAGIKPRDIFDIAAAGESHADAIVHELHSYRAEVVKALTTMNRLNPDFVDGAIAALAIKDAFKPIAKTAVERAKEILSAV
jgi:nucleotidyltransferase AbiEii toxin of type IV toxin-antitoxin system